MRGPIGSRRWNEYNLNPLTSNNWRTSLVPAPAVIPAPIAYIKVVAVKKLVVGSRDAHFKRPCHRVKPVAALALRARSVGAPQRAIGVSTGPPVPSFWIPVPAIDLVGTSQGASRVKSGWSLGPRSFTVKKLECSKQADPIFCHRIH